MDEYVVLEHGQFDFDKAGPEEWLQSKPFHIETRECFETNPPKNPCWEVAGVFESNDAALAYTERRIRQCLERRQKRQERQVSARKRFAVLKRDGYRCQLCGASSADGARLEVDHRTPLAKGGSNNLDNLWTLCQKCNAGKGTLSA